MTHANVRAVRIAGCAAAVLAVSLTSCTGSHGEVSSRPSTPSPSRTAIEPSEKKLTEQAQAALAAAHTGTLVEAGVERVADGVHTEPGLSEGKAYRLHLVCAGSGSARLRFEPAGAGAATAVPCDGSAVQQRLTGDELVRIDVAGAKGATGVIAWQIDAV
ncbi:hypothetical protein [Streptomyces sp. CSMPJR101]|uniref:hypothetical protein n=1 Tax=Streptomyces sp. CSMPJR101 TaxID=1279378 RepID=UPI0038535F92